MALVAMIMSGWRIYNASPLFGFSFPVWATLGGWLGGAIAWHFAAMWLLVVNGMIYAITGLIGGRFRRELLPIHADEVARDFSAALHLRLHHDGRRYNSVQRLFYLGVLLLGVLAVLTGLALWKPVQMQVIGDLVGGYEVVRRLHFIVMSGICAFIVVHLALVVLVPRTLISIIFGRRTVS